MNIRRGLKKDLPTVLKLIKELAHFEKALDQVSMTLSDLERDGFGDRPLYGFFVVEVADKVVATAIFYTRYSTWKGKRLYLEDIIVTESMRGQGIGKKLFDKILDYSKQNDFTGMMWQVLDWNKDAIKFYENYGAKFDNEWINCHIDF